MKKAFLEGPGSVLQKDAKNSKVEDIDFDQLYAQIGKLNLLGRIVFINMNIT